MTERTCTRSECERVHIAKGLCGPHYTQEWRKSKGGRRRSDEYYPRQCVTCGLGFDSSRPSGKFCSDPCKGAHYRVTMQTKCPLPDAHPVLVAIRHNDMQAKADRESAAAAVKFAWRTARECPGCACTFTPIYTPNATCCSKRCAKRMMRQRRRAREHDAHGSFTWSEFMRIARKFDYCCAYCGTKPDRLDPDHVVPLSRGGSNTPSNLLPTCMMCNSSKCAMTLSEWSQWLASRGLPARRTRWTPDDGRYTHLTDALLSTPARVA